MRCGRSVATSPTCVTAGSSNYPPMQETAGDMERQRVKLMDMIAALVGSLDEHPLFQSMVTNSGRTHARFGVQPSQYVAMGEALMWSLDCKFGASFTPELREAWRALRHSADRDAARGRRDLDRQEGYCLAPTAARERTIRDRRFWAKDDVQNRTGVRVHQERHLDPLILSTTSPLWTRV